MSSRNPRDVYIRGQWRRMLASLVYLESEDIIGLAQSDILRVFSGLSGIMSPWQVAERNHATFDSGVGMALVYARNLHMRDLHA